MTTIKETIPDNVPVVLHADQCKGCGRCVAFCPSGVLIISNQRNVNGYLTAAVAHPEKCTACGICFYTCPEPDGIIIRKEAVRKRKSEEKQSD